MADTVATVFLSPVHSGRIIWGAGSVLLLPAATDEALGTEKFGLGAPRRASRPRLDPWRCASGWGIVGLLRLRTVGGDLGPEDTMPESAFAVPRFSTSTGCPECGEEPPCSEIA
jgi:hypothetical protein